VPHSGAAASIERLYNTTDRYDRQWSKRCSDKKHQRVGKMNIKTVDTSVKSVKARSWKRVWTAAFAIFMAIALVVPFSVMAESHLSEDDIGNLKQVSAETKNDSAGDDISSSDDKQQIQENDEPAEGETGENPVEKTEPPTDDAAAYISVPVPLP
jgi:hypothetical protein